MQIRECCHLATVTHSVAANLNFAGDSRNSPEQWHHPTTWCKNTLGILHFNFDKSIKLTELDYIIIIIQLSSLMFKLIYLLIKFTSGN